MCGVTPSISDPSTLKQMNIHHVNAAGKFFQMFAGSSSHLTLFKDGVFHLEIRTSVSKEAPNFDQLMRNIANSWRNIFRRRFHAQGFVAHVYKIHRPAGFVCDAKGKDTRDLAGAIVGWMKAASEPSADILLEVIEADFLPNA